MGALLIAPSGDTQYWACGVSDSFRPHLDPLQTDHRIVQLETIWMLISVATFGIDLRDVDVILFNDNEGAVQAALKGYSPNPFMASAVAEFWLLASEYAWNP